MAYLFSGYLQFVLHQAGSQIKDTNMAYLFSGYLQFIGRISTIRDDYILGRPITSRPSVVF